MSNQKKKRLRPAGNSRYNSFLSVGDLLDIKASGLKNTIKAEFLPQFLEEDIRQTEAVLSKRSLLIDLRVSDINFEDIKRLSNYENFLRIPTLEHPETLLDIVRAFGGSGTKEERDKVLECARGIGLGDPEDSDSVAFWGGLLLVGAAFLLAACCNETDTQCDSDDDDSNGSSSGGK